MSLASMIRKRQPDSFATATVATLATQDGQKMRTVANVATVAVANPEAVKLGDGKLCSQWLFHFDGHDDLPVMFAPAVDQTAALAYYPDAVAAEPIPDQLQRKVTKADADEIEALVQAIYANDSDDDRAEALTAALADPGGALLCYRTIVKYRGTTVAAPVVGMVEACRCCHPGKSDAYSSRQDDPPLAYGANRPLRKRPDDGGASCDRYASTNCTKENHYANH